MRWWVVLGAVALAAAGACALERGARSDLLYERSAWIDAETSGGADGFQPDDEDVGGGGGDAGHGAVPSFTSRGEHEESDHDEAVNREVDEEGNTVPPATETVEGSFNMLDHNGDGKVTMKEVVSTYLDDHAADEMDDPNLPRDEHATIERFRRAFDAVDANHNGVVDLAEYRAAAPTYTASNGQKFKEPDALYSKYMELLDKDVSTELDGDDQVHSETP